MQIKYKSFIAEIYYISRTGCFYGEVINFTDLIIFHAENKKDLESVFIIAVEQYLYYIAYIEKSFIMHPNLLNLEVAEEQSVIY